MWFALLAALAVFVGWGLWTEPGGPYCECVGADGCSNDPKCCPVHGEARP